MNTRPSTFKCAWCGKSKPLARTGRMPRFCSDWCRRQPEQAERGLQGARAQKRSAERLIAHYEESLERYMLNLSATRSTRERSAAS